MNIPTWITLIRILLIPIFVVAFYLPYDWSNLLAAGVFSLACVTDWFDGYLARVLKQTSTLGAFLDPVADKLVVAVALVLIVSEKSIPFIAVPAAIIVSREIVISALREWMAEIGKRTSVAVNFVGKFKTIIQMIALVMLLCSSANLIYFQYAGTILLYIAVILTIWSMFMYLKIAWPDLNLPVETKQE